jgi:hypothetical protein
LNALPVVPLEIQAVPRKARDKYLLEVTVKNPAKTVALMAHLQLRKARSGERVLPVFYSDNYLSLVPGESKTLTVEAAAAQLGDEAPLLVVDGWNVTVNPSAASGKVRIVPNTEALVTTPAAASQPAENIGINCGGSQLGFVRFGAPLPSFGGDRDFRGGNTASTTNAVDTNVANAAPAEVYQSERWGACTYTIPVGKDASCTVRLHFAETKLAAGERKFNVEINGRRVLSDFDIAAESGKDKALVKEFKQVAPNANGQVVVAITRGAADQPKICGIQIICGQ